jgi:flagellar biosynthesis protein FlhA
MGVVLPSVRVRDDRHMRPNQYEIRIFGTRVSDGETFPDKWLAINPGGQRPKIDGVVATDPAYGLPALWIDDAQRTQARSGGYTIVDAPTVFLTHVAEVLKQNAANLITRAETERLIAKVREREISLVDELIPKLLSYGEVQRVLQSLVRERVPIRNLDDILEVLVDIGTKVRETDALTEHVRERLGRVICQALCDARGEIQVLTLDPKVEQMLTAAIRSVEDRATLILEPRFAEQIVRRLSEETEKMSRGNLRPVLLCSAGLRRHIRRFTERLLPQLSVVAMTEIPSHVSLRAFSVVAV